MNTESTPIEAVHTAVEQTTLNGESVLRVVKKDKIMEFDENTYAKLSGSTFHNGTIEVKMLSRLLPMHQISREDLSVLPFESIKRIQNLNPFM